MAAEQSTTSPHRPSRERPLRVGIVVGEASGDILGASLLEALQDAAPGLIEARGVGGPRMLAAGFHSLFDMERLAVMGLVEPLKRLPELIRMRTALRRHFLEWDADVVIGVDAPDFTLGLELALRRRGIKTAHLVSPSVWAWRQGRIHKIKRAVDLMMVLFPFEEQFYRDHQVPVVCIGHPLADAMPLEPDTVAARQRLGLSAQGPVVALLPGSRGSEVAQLAGMFLETAGWLHERRSDIRFVLPAANNARRAQIQSLLVNAPADLPLTLLDGESELAMTAADAVLMASGTTSLEAMLLKKPMVVAYRMGRWSYALLRRLVSTDFIALPNLLAGRRLVPECVQERARTDVLGPLILDCLQDSARRDQLTATFEMMHRDLRRGAGHAAAAAVLELAGQTA